MRNKKYRLGEKLPKKVRLDVYMRAIDYYKNILLKEDITDESKKFGIGLCLVLPCFLWGLDNYMDKGPYNNDWQYWKAADSFIEADILIRFVQYNTSNNGILERVFVRYYGLCNIVFEMSGNILIDENLFNKYHYLNLNYKVID